MNRTTKTIGKCRKCNHIIETAHARDFKWCKCGASALDGGKKVEMAVLSNDGVDGVKNKRRAYGK